MMKFLNKEQVERIRKMYPLGARIELTAPLNDTYSKLTTGSRGTVTDVFDNGDLGIAWDEGSSLHLIPDHDGFRVVPSIPKTVQDSIQGIRIVGKVNMFSWKEVLYIAEQCGFDELMEWLPNNLKLYANYILSGETE